MLPPDWQRRMVEMIRGAEPLDGGWFEPGPWLDATEQIAVYREQFVMRMRDALDGELPGLRALLGEALDPLYAEFLVEHPPDSWTLDHLARPFAGWLEAKRADRCHVDMARLDAAVMAAFSGPDPEALDPSALSPGVTLCFTPSARILSLAWTVHLARASIERGQVQVAPTRRDCALVVYRRGLEVRHWELGPLEQALLLAFSMPRPLEQGLGLALEQAPEHAARVGPALHEIAARRLLTRTSVAQEAG